MLPIVIEDEDTGLTFEERTQACETGASYEFARAVMTLARDFETTGTSQTRLIFK